MSSKLKTMLAKITALLLVSLVVVFYSSKTTSGSKRHKEGNRITYNGNVFETNITPTDTLWTIDSATGERNVFSYSQNGYDTVVKMNGEPVYCPLYKEATLEMRISENMLKTTISEMLMNRSTQIPRGRYMYYYNNIVVDKNGKVVYYDRHGGLTETGNLNNEPLVFEGMIPEHVKKELNHAIEELITTTTLNPLVIDGVPVAYNITVDDDFTIR